MDVELEKLHHACKHCGFFQLRNHGVSSSLVEKVKKGIQGLFNLPVEEKKLWQRPGEIEGFGQSFVVSEEQKLDWGDMFFITCHPQPELVIGITILLQINEMESLQIKKDGAWVPIKPLPDAFVVNVGDLLEIITNGTYASIEHRVVVNSEKERLSIATFYSLRLDASPNSKGILLFAHS
ncbi:hypothetical protein like AT4G25310 [Hibiscus trionum]|nr:hypothetical protein like AT4G25310 [Hibiscus trionum]